MPELTINAINCEQIEKERFLLTITFKEHPESIGFTMMDFRANKKVSMFVKDFSVVTEDELVKCRQKMIDALDNYDKTR